MHNGHMWAASMSSVHKIIIQAVIIAVTDSKRQIKLEKSQLCSIAT